MACLRLKPTFDAPLAQGLPAKIIRLHRSGRRAKAHISMKPNYFRRQFPELAEGRCAFSGAWSPLSRWRKRRCAARALLPPPAGFTAMPMHLPPALRGGFARLPQEAPGQEKNRKASKHAKFTMRLAVTGGLGWACRAI
jgi:hypothetical protein